MQNEKCKLQSEDAGNAIIHSAFLRSIGISIRTIPRPTLAGRQRAIAIVGVPPPSPAALAVPLRYQKWI